MSRHTGRVSYTFEVDDTTATTVTVTLSYSLLDSRDEQFVEEYDVIGIEEWMVSEDGIRWVPINLNHVSIAKARRLFDEWHRDWEVRDTIWASYEAACYV